MALELSGGAVVFTAQAGRDSGPDCCGWWFLKGLPPEVGGGCWYSTVKAGALPAAGLSFRGERALSFLKLAQAGMVPWATAAELAQAAARESSGQADNVVKEWRRRLSVVGVVGSDFISFIAATHRGVWYGPIMVAGFASVMSRGGGFLALPQRPGWVTMAGRDGAAGWFEVLDDNVLSAGGYGPLRPVVRATADSPPVSENDCAAAGGYLASAEGGRRAGGDFLAPAAGWWRVILGPLSTAVWVFVTEGGRVAFESWRELAGCALVATYGGLAWPEFASVCRVHVGMGPIVWR